MNPPDFIPICIPYSDSRFEIIFPSLRLLKQFNIVLFVDKIFSDKLSKRSRPYISSHLQGYTINANFTANMNMIKHVLPPHPPTPQFLPRNFRYKVWKVILLLYKSIVRPHLDHFSFYLDLHSVFRFRIWNNIPISKVTKAVLITWCYLLIKFSVTNFQRGQGHILIHICRGAIDSNFTANLKMNKYICSSTPNTLHPLPILTQEL